MSDANRDLGATRKVEIEAAVNLATELLNASTDAGRFAEGLARQIVLLGVEALELALEQATGPDDAEAILNHPTRYEEGSGIFEELVSDAIEEARGRGYKQGYRDGCEAPRDE